MNDAQTWQEWSDALWDAMERRYGYPGLAHLEQKMLRSKREQRCVECGDAGTEQQESTLIASVSHYWMCADCDSYWREKGK